jgi:kynurenine formamidase
LFVDAVTNQNEHFQTSCAWTDRADFTGECVKKWERDHGPIPAGAVVAMRTDWAKRCPDAKAMENKDAKGIAHYPGWSLPALKYLSEERKITASGHETSNTDPGIATTKNGYSLETSILSTNHYQIELLDQMPEAGGIVFVTFPKPKAARDSRRAFLPSFLLKSAGEERSS